MKRPRVLVVYKKSAYQIYVRERREDHIRTLLRKKSPVVAHLRTVENEQVATMAEVERVLRDLEIEFRARYRAERIQTRGFDLMITVGGDGTLLEASHYVDGVPILGVNSSPSTSVGYFAAATLDNFESCMKRLLAGRLRPVMVQRMTVLRNGRPIGVPVLNDALFCSDNPAATSRYILQVGDRSEHQKSSGMWISTAAGSTAALRSAGGPVLPPRSQKLAYVVREPYHDPRRRLRLLKGAIHPSRGLSVISRMRQSAIYLDGSHLAYRIRMGDRIDFQLHESPLALLGFRRPDNAK